MKIEVESNIEKLVEVATLPLSIPPSGTQAFYFIKRPPKGKHFSPESNRKIPNTARIRSVQNKNMLKQLDTEIPTKLEKIGKNAKNAACKQSACKKRNFMQ